MLFTRPKEGRNSEYKALILEIADYLDAERNHDLIVVDIEASPLPKPSWSAASESRPEPKCRKSTISGYVKLRDGTDVAIKRLSEEQRSTVIEDDPSLLETK